MAADITPEKAKLETDENLTLMANLYRSDSGAHLIVINEIKRRDRVKSLKTKVVGALIIGLISLLFASFRG